MPLSANIVISFLSSAILTGSSRSRHTGNRKRIDFLNAAAPCQGGSLDSMMSEIHQEEAQWN
ncbi:MAG: hypothetical protein AB1656_02975 [Candidatus Omnitrophota bacterium]